MTSCHYSDLLVVAVRIDGIDAKEARRVAISQQIPVVWYSLRQFETPTEPCEGRTGAFEFANGTLTQVYLDVSRVGRGDDADNLLTERHIPELDRVARAFPGVTITAYDTAPLGVWTVRVGYASYFTPS